MLEGQRIDHLPYEQMRAIRGRKIGAIFQDPLTSLNPLYTIGRQLTETIQTHLNVSAEEARKRAIRLLQDTGIPAAEQTRVFEPFFRASNVGKVSGSGLGLLIVKQIAERHRGRVEFTSSPVGTKVELSLPIGRGDPVG